MTNTNLEKRVERIELTLKALRTALNAMLGEPEQVTPEFLKKDGFPDFDERMLYSSFMNMTPRQHAAMQMVLDGCSNADIGKRFGVGEVGAKTYITGIYRHLGIVKLGTHNKRAFIREVLGPYLDEFPDEDYERIAGIPKNWHKDYRKIGKKYKKLFEKTSRKKGK